MKIAITMTILIALKVMFTQFAAIELARAFVQNTIEKRVDIN